MIGFGNHDESYEGNSSHPKVNVQRIFKPASDSARPPPAYQTPGASGFDLQADEYVLLSPGDRKLVSTGLKVAIPPGYELQIRSRSGMALKQGLIVLNEPGTVDADYRGEVKVMLYNASDRSQGVAPGERIAQGVVCPVVQARFHDVEELPSTERGEGGFGST